MMMSGKKNVVILGSTGSIGLNALKVVDRFPDLFEVAGLSAYENGKLLGVQIEKYRPRYVAGGSKILPGLQQRFRGRNIRFFDSPGELGEMAGLPDVDTVLIGMTGSAALEPFLKAVRGGKTVAPANKEALVIAGDLIMREARRNKARVIPVDSEQSAIFQCLKGNRKSEVYKVHLTASGGALRKTPRSRFRDLTVRDILRHPRWSMGRKITVDSATLMNKGFEIIEAMRLFGLRVEQIEVVIHPEAIVHSMVQFRDGSILAQMGITDMQLPIQYALTYPDRLPGGLPELDFFDLKRLHFEKPDLRKFPCLSLALEAAAFGGDFPAVLNAANEEIVAAFLKEKIRFDRIPVLLEEVISRFRPRKDAGLEDVLEADRWARSAAQKCLPSGN